MLIKFEIYFDGEYWCARGVGADIFTQGETMDSLMENIKEATALHFEEDLEKAGLINVLALSEMEVRCVSKTATG
ncbi:type II toxin-antitoxin system HicB family antitoxin [bacterium]|nr:type II toxin-antitoxin system HicB family antitoxin [bacterium]MBU1599331.1 type II toxin-antitoxin system HicB family antitoxin [bacterium]